MKSETGNKIFHLKSTKKCFVKPNLSFLPFPMKGSSAFLLPRHYQGQQSCCQEGILASPLWFQALTAPEEASVRMPGGQTSKCGSTQALRNLPAVYLPPLKYSARCPCSSAFLKISFGLCLCSSPRAGLLQPLPTSPHHCTAGTGAFPWWKPPGCISRTGVRMSLC